ncbi:MAG TPA: LON peptidase substrate-binding domain-containing protein [Tepidisphaeraceae bacterium]|nr:LON peptidase substrate-binding domain-containing protein [Tepidisphaeraceae bacterium]
MGFSNPSSDLSAVPLFPLPNVVLFPRAVLPLHIFERRYKTMTADVLNGNKQIAMALLRPGWEKSYYGKPAIEPVVCVGTILSHEKLPDGTYNFLLQGHTRARIVRELRGRDVPYRVAELEKVIQAVIPAAELRPHRQRMVELFSKDKLSKIPLAGQILRILASDLPTEDVADLIAFAMFDDTLLKQSLLAEVDVARRVQRILAELEGIKPRVRPASDSSQASLN